MITRLKLLTNYDCIGSTRVLASQNVNRWTYICIHNTRQSNLSHFLVIPLSFLVMLFPQSWMDSYMDVCVGLFLQLVKIILFLQVARTMQSLIDGVDEFPLYTIIHICSILVLI